MRPLAMLGVLAVLAGCSTGVPPEVLSEYQSRTLYTCCNIHYEGAEITDANYFVGSTLPLGSPVGVEELTSESVTFSAGATVLTLYHSYGTEQESAREYFDKVLVTHDPKKKVAGFPQAVRDAIRDARVERGMTREQVIMSLGYPATHRTPSTSTSEWTYWYNRWITYKVQFDEGGRVSNVVGRPAPTQDRPVS